jgi:PAS domain S-box-containing protein
MTLAANTSRPGHAADSPLLSRLLEHIREIVLVLEGGGIIAACTPAAEERLGYAAGTLAGGAITAIAPSEDAAALAGAAQHCTCDRPVTVHHRLRRRDGDLCALQSTVVRLQDDERVCVFIINREDSVRPAPEGERERRELNRRASHRLEAVGQLSAGIAHEINTPLQFVGDSVSFLREAVDELVGLIAQYRETLYQDTPVPLEERRDAMRRAEEVADVEDLCERIPAAFDRTADGIERVRSIVMAMKRFSHASHTEMAPADINEAIETTLTVCRNEYKYVADIDRDLGELEPVVCKIDELNQVFLNLIINAAHAIEEKHEGRDELGLIRIATRVEGEEAVIEVTDDGPGIPAALQERIFEPFFTTKEIGKGTGQGLALALAAVQRHAGSIECVSAPGEGTTFSVRLPLRPVPVETGRAG